MKRRLVWNFEINQNDSFILESLPYEVKEELSWEARFFWPESKIICLQRLDDYFFDFSRYQVKHRYDEYFLLPDVAFNVKQRSSTLVYKPLLSEEEKLQGYGKKINLVDYPADELLPGVPSIVAARLLEQVELKSYKIGVEKEALIYKFATEPTIKFELARLKVMQKIYFSVCIEGHSRHLVRFIAYAVLGNEIACDYVNFLKQVVFLNKKDD